MNLRNLYRIGVVALLVQAGVAAWAFSQTGLLATVPTHWGPDGEVDGYGPAWLSFGLVPVISVAVVAMFGLIPRIEPRRQNLQLTHKAAVPVDHGTKDIKGQNLRLACHGPQYAR